MCALLAFSVYGLRRSHYETFLSLHISLSAIVILTMYYHVEIFTSGEWYIFIYPCLVVWLFDRFLRTLRILAFNLRFWGTKATATYDAHSNLVRMEVPFKNSWIKPKAGTYYYIYVLDDILYAHQNHPFTLAYVSSDTTTTLHSNTTSISNPRALLRPRARRSSSIESTESDTLLFAPLSSTGFSSSLVFLIRPYDGFTSRLAKCASRSQSPTSLRVLVEGPYGHTLPLYTFPNILFIVGGTGIAVLLSHITTILSQNSNVTELRIVWAVREYAFLTSLIQEFGGLLDDERIIFEAYITQDVDDKDEGDEDGERDKALRRVKIEAGRPDVVSSVEQAAQDAGQDRLAVVACGPGRMADEARRTSVKMLGRGYHGVEYFEESFKW